MGSGSSTITTTISSIGEIVTKWDYIVSEEENYYKAIDTKTGVTYCSEQASTTINYAINALTSGTVRVEAGNYKIGSDKIVTQENRWTPTASSILINQVSEKTNNTIQIDVLNPNITGLIAHYNFESPINLSGNRTLGFWFKPSIDLTNASTIDCGSPFRLILSTSPNCGSPIFIQEIIHPEWVTATWKYYTVPAVPAGSALPSNLSNIRSIGLEVFNNIDCLAPKDSYNIKLGEIHAFSGEIKVHDNIRLVGAGVNNTIIKLNPQINIPMIVLEGANIEITGLNLDGNYDNQNSIDACIGIYDSGNSQIKIYNNYIHHIKGAGILIRGIKSEIYNNLIEWTQNPNIALSYYPSSIRIYSNTLKYATDDDNIRVSAAQNVTIENNLIVGVTSSLLTEKDATTPTMLVNTTPLEWNGIRIDRNTSDTLIQYNKIYNVTGYGIALNSGHDNIVQYNEIYYSERNQISIQNWSGTSLNAHIIGNLVVGGKQRGINEAGINTEVSNNWCKNNRHGGIFLLGINHYGEGNFVEESTNAITKSMLSIMPPELSSFTAGASG